MSIFSRIYSILLIFAVTGSSFLQLHNTGFGGEFSPQSEEDSIPGYLYNSSLNVWGILYLDAEETSLFDSLYLDSEDKKDNSSRASFAGELLLKIFSSHYLLFSKKIENSLTIRELLYPFHFYF